MPIKVAVVGATGYAGVELVRILAGHPEVELSLLTSRQYAGHPIAEIYPSLTGVLEDTCHEMDPDLIGANSDVAILALPHKIPMAVVPELLDQNIKVIDLSADFRFSDPSVYEASYQPHSARSYIPEAVYGLSEIYRDEIQHARLVGNPGCYPTSILLPLIPLLRNDLVEIDTLISDSKSGVSGAGRSPSLTTHFCEVHEAFKAYKIAEHRHNPEIDEILSKEAGQEVHITFVPHLVPMSRGMLTTIYAAPRKGVGVQDIADCLADTYSNCCFVRLRSDSGMPETCHVRGTNFCDIGYKMDEKNGRLILISAIDNLVKGAAGQAVQNMNMMLGFNENSGLMITPYSL